MNVWIVIGILLGGSATFGFIGWQIYYQIKIRRLRTELRQIYEQMS